MKPYALSLFALAALLPGQNQGITLSNLVDGYVEVPYSTHVVPQSGITVEAWVTYDDSTIPTGWRYPTVVRQNRNAGQESFFLRVEANNNNSKTIKWLVAANSTVSVNWTFQPGQLLTWTHLAGTWDGQTARLFVDGVEVGTPANGSGPLNDQGDVLRIGKGSDVGSPMEVWNGDIDEVRLWPFARTAAEIMATKDMQLSTIPGQVSTWNFNGDAVDSSAGRNGTISAGGVTFTNATPTLTPYGFPGVAGGNSTNGCLGPIEIATSSLPRAGTAGFAIVAQRMPATAATICALGTQGLGSPLNLAGIDIWVNPGFLLGGFTSSVDALGTARLGLPIPAGTPTALTLAAQFISIDPCGPAGLTASNLIVFSIMP